MVSVSSPPDSGLGADEVDRRWAPQQHRKLIRRRRRIVAAVLIALCAGGVAAALFFNGDTGSEPARSPIRSGSVPSVAADPSGPSAEEPSRFESGVPAPDTEPPAPLPGSDAEYIDSSQAFVAAVHSAVNGRITGVELPDVVIADQRSSLSDQFEDLNEEVPPGLAELADANRTFLGVIDALASGATPAQLSELLTTARTEWIDAVSAAVPDAQPELPPVATPPLTSEP